MSVNILVPDKNLGCQDLLKLQPSCYGWLRRKTKLHKSCAYVERSLTRSSSFTSKIPWWRCFVIVYRGCVYVFSDETSSEQSSAIALFQYEKVEHVVDDTTKGVPWPFKLTARPIDNKLKHIYFGASSETELHKWIASIKAEISTAFSSGYMPMCQATSTKQNPKTTATQSDSSDDEYFQIEPDDEEEPKPTRASSRPLPPLPSTEPDVERGKGNLAAKRLVPKTLVKPKVQPIVEEHPQTPSKPVLKVKPSVPAKPRPTESTSKLKQFESPLVKAATWTGTPEEAQKLLRSLDEGVFLLRRAREGADGHVLQVICDGKPTKYKIDFKDSQYGIGVQKQFLSVDELLEYYQTNSLPNHSTTLTQPYSAVVEPEYCT